MKLLLKLSFIFVLVFGLGLAAITYLSHDLLQANARTQVLDQAEMIVGTAAAMRHYTDNHVKKALDTLSFQPDSPRDLVFHPETVPAFAATEMFNFLRENNAAFADYYYKEATLNPTNLRDRTTEWEADIVQDFRNHADKPQITGERSTATGRSLYLARPLVATKSCLACHSTPDVAPAAMIKAYGSVNGFGWKENEIIGAQIISVPITKATDIAYRTYVRLMTCFVAVGLLTLIVLDVALYFTVIRALNRFARDAERISKGEMDIPELQVKGNDEISTLAAAFNRMHRSLAAAVKMLG